MYSGLVNHDTGQSSSGFAEMMLAMKPDGPLPSRVAQGKFSAMVVDNESALKDKKPRCFATVELFMRAISNFKDVMGRGAVACEKFAEPKQSESSDVSTK